MNKLVVFSGVQPSGDLTIGNYIGAIRQWIKLQHDYQCIYCIVDLHAVMSSNYVYSLSQKSLDTLALYLACGIDPDDSIIFVQSHIAAHTQLSWLLNYYTYFGELNRMTQFKEKSEGNKKECQQGVNVGLFNYPVLMAADILLYRTNLVPVGKDQSQHLELTRDIAKRFNRKYGSIFIIPKIIVPVFGAKVMSLLDPNKKMSKSDSNANNVIFLLDNIDVVSKKINCAVTDSEMPPIIRYDPVNKPGISNLLEILSTCSEKSIVCLEKNFKNQTYVQLKNEVIQSVSLFLMKLQDRYRIERSNKKKLYSILRNGAVRAYKIANVTLEKVYRVMGFLEK